MCKINNHNLEELPVIATQYMTTKKYLVINIWILQPEFFSNPSHVPKMTPPLEAVDKVAPVIKLANVMVEAVANKHNLQSVTTQNSPRRKLWCKQAKKHHLEGMIPVSMLPLPYYHILHLCHEYGENKEPHHKQYIRHWCQHKYKYLH